MPKNFDELIASDLSFIVRGETFRMEYVRPEVLAAWEDEEEVVLDADEPDKKTAAAALERLDARICSFLSEDEAKRWRALREREDGAVPYVQLREIVRWMVEVQSERPTETPSGSAGGRGRTVPSSGARRPSAAAA